MARRRRRRGASARNGKSRGASVSRYGLVLVGVAAAVLQQFCWLFVYSPAAHDDRHIVEAELFSRTEAHHEFGNFLQQNRTASGALPVASTLPRNPQKTDSPTLSEDRLDSICSVSPGFGPERPWGYRSVAKVERIDLDSKLQQLRDEYRTTRSSNTRSALDTDRIPKLLCVVLTDSTRHGRVLPAILSTYASDCDGFLAASNATDETLHAVNVFGQGNGHDNAVDHSSDRIPYFRTLQYLYRRYKDTEFDFFHVVSDNAYLFPNNLKYHLARIAWKPRPQSAPELVLYMGDGIIPAPDKPTLFCTSGSGITFNIASLRLASSETVASCMQRPVEPNDVGKPYDHDRRLGHCLASTNRALEKCQMGLDPVDGSSLYHEHGPDYVGRWTVSDKGPPVYAEEIYSKFGIQIQNKLSRVSRSTVAFHLVDGGQPMEGTTEQIIHRVHTIHRGFCDSLWNSFLGAADEASRPGYVHDPKYLKTHPLSFTRRIPYFQENSTTSSVEDICEAEYGTGYEKKRGYKALLKIRNNLISMMAQTPSKNKAASTKTVLCMVYTHSGGHHRIRSIAETYGPRCDGFMAASNETDRTIGAVNLLHHGPESYTYDLLTPWQFTHRPWHTC